MDRSCPTRQNPAGQVLHVLETLLLQELRSPLAAPAGLALHHDVLVGIELANTLRQIVQRNQMTADVRDLILVRLAHIQHKHILARVRRRFSSSGPICGTPF